MPASGIFTFITGSIDAALNTFVVQVSTSLASGITPLVVSGMTIWVLVYGYSVMRNEVSDPVSAFVKTVAKNAFIFGLALNAGIYQSEIVDGVNALSTGLVQIVSPVGNATSVFDALDQLNALDNQLALQMLNNGETLLPIGGWLDLLCGVLLLLANAALLLIMGGWSILADASLKFVLGLGPLFIACLAFDPLKQFFTSWMNKVANYVLLTMLMAALGTFVVKMATAYVTAMAVSTQETSNAISDVFGFILLVGVALVLAWQMPNLAASLTGGTPLSSSFMGAAAGALLGRRGGQESGQSDGNAGGTIEGVNTADNKAKPEVDAAAKVPAYRKATLDHLRKRND
jgi:type IV secretion system protein VirB6